MTQLRLPHHQAAAALARAPKPKPAPRQPRRHRKAPQSLWIRGTAPPRRVKSLKALLRPACAGRKDIADARPRSLGRWGPTKAERRDTRALERDLDAHGVDRRRPRDEADCPPEGEACPFVSCSMNLYLDVDHRGRVKLNFPGKEIDELEETCALRFARRIKPPEDDYDVLESTRENPTDVVAAMFNITPERLRQIEAKALAKARGPLARMHR